MKAREHQIKALIAQGEGLLDPATSVPYPKNPVLGAFFREIDWADELGSGMRKMMLYGKTNGGADPQLIEGDIRLAQSDAARAQQRQEQAREPEQTEAMREEETLVQAPRMRMK